MPRPSPATTRSLIASLVVIVSLAAIVAASIWLRWPGFVQGGFASHDVAGILYNAMVIARGGLAYVDTLELKAPGTFYLASWLAGPEGRDIAQFQIAANVCALLSLLAVAGCAWRMWGRWAALAAAGVYALHDAQLDSMDANYVTWANLPQIVAAWLALEAWRGPASRWRATLWLLAGACAGFAALCKQQDGVVLLAILAMATSRGSLRERVQTVAWASAGFVLAHVPIVLRYAVAGQLGALVDGYVLNRWGIRYVLARDVGLLDALREGALASAHFLGLALVLAAFAGGYAGMRALAHVSGRAPLDADELARVQVFAWIGVWLLGTLFAASLGARFYKGYFVAAAAPASLLAAAPFGLLGARCRVHWLARLLALSLASLLAVRAWMQLEQTRSDRGRPHDEGGRRVAAHVLAHSQPDDTIWVWGWHLWDVYPLTGRMAASRIYKSLGILTQPNDDTWRRGATPLRFVDSPYADQLLADLDRNRPAWIVLGSTVPHREFRELQTFLRAHYRRDYTVQLGRVQFWRRR